MLKISSFFLLEKCQNKNTTIKRNLNVFSHIIHEYKWLINENLLHSYLWEVWWMKLKKKVCFKILKCS